ncbi:MAG: chloride channel protein [Gammaproteobacteria bacterium]|nr:chloride channel protein [Gammaproteobacteria bacterium]
MLDKIRLRLSSEHQGLIELSLLGVITGILAAAIIIAFRLVVEGVQIQFLPDGNPENYEALPRWVLLVLPMLGGLVIGLIFQLLSTDQRSVGVVHTIERLDYHQGRLPLSNFLAQFLGAAISIISGHSVGREGPSIHLGAAGGSLVGQWLRLPNNAGRVLIACGVAAAIAASFNTPIAGVIFAIEVIVLEISTGTLLPVILAAVTATVIAHTVFGTDALLASNLNAGMSIEQIPWVIVTGISIGLLGAAFIRMLLLFTLSARQLPVWLRFSLAGLATGLCAIIAPQIMGIGYDTVSQALSGELLLASLLVIVLMKLFATTLTLGLGLPGGLIGPTIVIGATAGGAVGMLAMDISPQDAGHVGQYALIGIGAMMGAVIQAPLTALMTMFELTHNPQILLPGMLAVAIAQLTAARIFGQKAVFRALLAARGLDYKNDPAAQALRRVGVTSVMEKSVVHLENLIPTTRLKSRISKRTRWILSGSDQDAYIMPASDLAAFLERDGIDDEINLLDVPATRLSARALSAQATLQDAYELLTDSGGEAVYIVSHSGIIGVLTLEDILTVRSPRPKSRKGDRVIK